MCHSARVVDRDVAKSDAPIDDQNVRTVCEEFVDTYPAAEFGHDSYAFIGEYSYCGGRYYYSGSYEGHAFFSTKDCD